LPSGSGRSGEVIDGPIDVSLVRSLVADQFPEWSAVEVRPMKASGWDNRTFHLGEDMVVRMPSDGAYAAQVEREQRWLPFLASRLPLAVPAVLGAGLPGHGYPWRWSVYRFIAGERAADASALDLGRFAADLAAFLLALQSIDTTGGPAPGDDNFHRGGELVRYDAEVREAIGILHDRIDAPQVLAAWPEATATRWSPPGVWVHGDVAPANLLVREGRLTAVIDFGNLAVGDPACDLAIAWTFLDPSARAVFRTTLGSFDEATWRRARGWALWKALIVAADLAQTNAPEFARPFGIIESIVAR
jgi:aminoglycoside phosphotransferase (APT) family kinase protein